MKLEDLEKLTLEELLKIVEKGDIAEPRVFRIYLDNAKSKEFWSFSGNYFCLLDASHNDAWIKVNFNRVETDPIKFEKGLIIRRPFTKFWVTSDAQSGKWVDILVGATSPKLLEIIDNRTALIQSTLLEAIRDELKGDTDEENWDTEKTVGTSAVQVLASNSDRKCLLVQAKSTNTGIIYIGFDNTVTSTKWVAELQAGQSLMIDDYRGEIYAIASADGQKLGWGEW